MMISVVSKQKHIFGIIVSILCGQILIKDAKASDKDIFDIGATLILQRESYGGVLTDSGSEHSASFLRRADIKIEIPIFDETSFNVKIKTQRSGEISASDAYVDLDMISGFSIRAGRFDPEFGHELTGSTNWTTAIERSAIYDLLLMSGDGSDGEGVSLSYSSNTFHGNLSIYHNTDTTFYSSRLVSITAPANTHRLMFGYSVTCTDDMVADDGEINSDMGFWYLDQDSDVNSIKLAKSLDDDVISDNREMGLELAYQYHSALFQTEYVRRNYTSQNREITALAEGHFVQLAYTLTGEARRYKKSNATFKGIKPSHHHGTIPGAWEIFLRHEDIKVTQELNISANDPTSDVRRANVNTIGLNWYYRENLRLSSSYSRIYAPADDNDVGQTRGSGMAIRILVTL
jgi:phosphate-selective porin OprO/OprP